MGRRKLGRRKRACLRWVAEQFTVSIPDFIRVLNLHPDTRKPLGYDSGWRVMKRFKDEGLIATKQVHPDLPQFIYLTEQGLKQLDLAFPFYEPRTYEYVEQVDKATGEVYPVLLGKAIFHTDAVNKARLYFEERYGDVGWRSERLIRQDERREAASKWEHRPDAQAFPEEKHTSVQAENTNKGISRLEDILLYQWLTFEQTYYFCTNASTYALVRDKVQELDPDLSHFKLVKPADFMSGCNSR